jgi:hypothetical protein
MSLLLHYRGYLAAFHRLELHHRGPRCRQSGSKSPANPQVRRGTNCVAGRLLQASLPRPGRTWPVRSWRCLLRQALVPTFKLSLPNRRALEHAMRTSRSGCLVTSPTGQRDPSRAPSRLIVEQICRPTPWPSRTTGEGAGCAQLTPEGLAGPLELLATATPRVSRPLARLLQRRDHSRLTYPSRELEPLVPNEVIPTTECSDRAPPNLGTS